MFKSCSKNISFSFILLKRKHVCLSKLIYYWRLFESKNISSHSNKVKVQKIPIVKETFFLLHDVDFFNSLASRRLFWCILIVRIENKFTVDFDYALYLSLLSHMVKCVAYTVNSYILYDGGEWKVRYLWFFLYYLQLLTEIISKKNYVKKKSIKTTNPCELFQAPRWLIKY